jgi:nicotinate phosphoribosyltransferase
MLDHRVVSASFGIGTSLTNDFYTVSSHKTTKSKALNIVIKLAAVDNQPCVKISDDHHKVWCGGLCLICLNITFQSTGDHAMVEKVKELLNLM